MKQSATDSETIKCECSAENSGCDDKKCCSSRVGKGSAHTGGAVYGLGMIGAAVYYIIAANSFWIGVLGVLKAIVWPAFLVYSAMHSLGM